MRRTEKKENDEERAIANARGARERERKLGSRTKPERTRQRGVAVERGGREGESLRQNVAENANADTVMLPLA